MEPLAHEEGDASSGFGRDTLPADLTSFVGRERAVAELIRLLDSGRLVTVTGGPGSGKSRLAVETARVLAPTYADGVRYANLAACVSEGPAEEIISVSLGLATSSSGVTSLPGGSITRAPLESIVDFLAGREMLLLFDGADHVVEGVAHIASAIVRRAPRVRVLVTSRISLAVAGELVWHAPLLELPAPGDSPERIAASESVRLFVDRASAVDSGFVLSPDVVDHVARICIRLDGNPLALELAAARVGTLGVGQLARRLEQSLELLAAGRRDVGDPHATLLGAIEWGYDLLSRPEQQLFERLSVFRGEFTMPAAEAVAGGDPLDPSSVVDLIGSLLDKSMIAVVGDVEERRYRLGAALREFAQTRLDEEGGAAEMRRRHAAYHRAVAVDRADELRRRLGPDLLEQLERMFPDLMAAIDHFVAVEDATAAHEMLAGLYLFWFARRHEVARTVAARILSMDGAEVDPVLRAHATIGAGMLDATSGEWNRGLALLEKGRALAAAEDAPLLVAEAQLYMGFALQQTGDAEAAAVSLRTARQTFAAAGEAWGVGWSDWFLGTAAMLEGDFAAAAVPLAASLAVFRETDTVFGIANALAMLGTARRMLGDPHGAIRHHRESLGILERLSDRRGIAAAEAALGLAFHDAGDPHSAGEHLGRAIGLARTMGNGAWLAELLQARGDALFDAGDPEAAAVEYRQSLEVAAQSDGAQSAAAAKRALLGLAWWAWQSGHIERAVSLFSTVESLEDVAAPPTSMRPAADPGPALVEAQARLGAQVYDSVRRAGRSMNLEDASAYAREPVSDEPARLGPRTLSLEEVELGERVSAELSEIGERREVRVAGVRLAGRRRRPSGEREPLPRDLRASGRFWLAMGLGAIAVWASLWAFPSTTEWWEARDMTITQWLVDLRQPWLTDLMDGIHALGSLWFFRPLRWAMLLALVFFKRWRHFFGAVIVFAFVELIVRELGFAIGRPRPFVEILAPWAGYSHPAAPVASVSATFAVIALALVPRGRWRTYWLATAGVLISLLVLSRIYLGVDHLSDGIVGAMFGAAVAVVVFRLFAPESVFPVVYRRGTTAHLDVSGQRGRAITSAVADQLGIQVTNIELFGAEGSGGSTPLRLTAAGDPDTYLFAKLYSTSHLRADRWYKIGRTILYGALEDEVRFTSVRRLVEYEDYMLLRMKQAGVPSAEPFGIVEITPEREYLIVTEFLQDAQEITKAEVDDAVIDDALLMIRRLWDAGLAHRDVKPANVLVKDGKIRLIDVAFATIRPTPWRQAVDLANMLIILALRSTSQRVYNRALRFFAPEDIAEAFAATRSVTIPSQSRSQLKEVRKLGNDLISEFRDLAPAREPIAIQRWSARRIGLTIGAALAIAILVSIVIENLASGGLI